MRRILPAVLVTVLGAATMSVGCSDATNLGPLAQLDEVKRLRAAGEHAEGGAAPAAVASSGTGWGTLQGNFVFEGDSPAAKILPTGGKDAPTCNPGGIPDESLVINAQNKGIKNIVIYARKVSRVNEEYAATESQPVELDQKNCMFLTHVSAVRVSQPIVLKNSEGSVGHNTSISPPADKGTNPVVPPTGTAEYKFSRQQNVPVPVTCSIHPWMKSYVIPRDNPYFAVTDANGAFTIKSLPAGEKLEFQVWHESSSGAQGALEVPGLTDGKGRFVKTLAEGEDLKLGELKVPTADFKL